MDRGWITPMPPASETAATSSGLLHGYMAPQISGTSMPSWRVTAVSRRDTALALHLDAAPECDVILDLRRRRLGVRVVPGGVLPLDTVHDDRVVARRPLPAADRMGRAGLQVLAAHRLGREVDVPLHKLEFVRLRDHRSVPDGSGQFRPFLL